MKTKNLIKKAYGIARYMLKHNFPLFLSSDLFPHGFGACTNGFVHYVTYNNHIVLVVSENGIRYCRR